jgi:Zn-dependent peptidase ImmA (M78 family)
MRREFCDEDDFVLGGQGRRLGSDISRMEYQSNYFASSLLMPRTNFVADFWRVLKQLDIQDRGYGALYVDNQRCNVDNYMYVTTALRGIYHVSRAATRIRLESLGLLRDVRTGPISAHDR